MALETLNFLSLLILKLEMSFKTYLTIHLFYALYLKK